MEALDEHNVPVPFLEILRTRINKQQKHIKTKYYDINREGKGGESTVAGFMEWG